MGPVARLGKRGGFVGLISCTMTRGRRCSEIRQCYSVGTTTVPCGCSTRERPYHCGRGLRGGTVGFVRQLRLLLYVHSHDFRLLSKIQLRCIQRGKEPGCATPTLANTLDRLTSLKVLVRFFPIRATAFRPASKPKKQLVIGKIELSKPCQEQMRPLLQHLSHRFATA
jgi:hypothetical protein